MNAEGKEHNINLQHTQAGVCTDQPQSQVCYDQDKGHACEVHVHAHDPHLP